MSSIAARPARLSFEAVGFFDSLKAWFSREVAEVKQTAETMKTRLESELDRRERELEATPQERMEMIGEEISDDPFADVRAKIEQRQAHAGAVGDLAAEAESGEDPEAEDPSVEPPDHPA